MATPDGLGYKLLRKKSLHFACLQLNSDTPYCSELYLLIVYCMDSISLHTVCNGFFLHV